jgi:multiple antibiotic resistance protein
MDNLDSIFKFAITMLSILNPIGIIPIFLTLTESHSDQEIKRMSSTCSIAVMVTIIISLVLGKKILTFFGIGLPSFTVGGGLLIFSMAFSMMSAKNSAAKMNSEEIKNYGGDVAEIGIVPLAIPLLSGPGTISTCIIWSDMFKNQWQWLGVFIVILCLGLVVKLILNFARKIGKRLGRIGMSVMSRIMGLILLALSIEMITRGLKELLPALANLH